MQAEDIVGNRCHETASEDMEDLASAVVWNRMHELVRALQLLVVTILSVK
jgi:hypothetical protein